MIKVISQEDKEKSWLSFLSIRVQIEAMEEELIGKFWKCFLILAAVCYVPFATVFWLAYFQNSYLIDVPLFSMFFITLTCVFFMIFIATSLSHVLKGLKEKIKGFKNEYCANKGECALRDEKEVEMNNNIIDRFWKAFLNLSVYCYLPFACVFYAIVFFAESTADVPLLSMFFIELTCVFFLIFITLAFSYAIYKSRYEIKDLKALFLDGEKETFIRNNPKFLIDTLQGDKSSEAIKMLVEEYDKYKKTKDKVNGLKI